VTPARVVWNQLYCQLYPYRSHTLKALNSDALKDEDLWNAAKQETAEKLLRRRWT